MAANKKIGVVQLNSLENLVDGSFVLPARKPAEITIKVLSVGLNPVDYKFMNGSITVDLPAVLGHECVGEIVDSDCIQDIGKRVLAYLPGPHTQSSGALSEMLNVPSNFTTVISKSSPVEYAAYPLCGLTAMRCFLRIKNEGVKHCFVTGVSGGVGWLFAQLCIENNIDVYTIVRSEASRNKITTNLSKDVNCLVTNDPADIEAIRRHFKRDYFDASVDLVGGEYKLLCLSLCGFNGHFITIVEEQSGNIDLFDARKSPAFQKNLSIHFEFLGSQAYFGTALDQETYKNELCHLLPLIESQVLHYPNIRVLYGLDSVTVKAGLEDLQVRRLLDTNKIIVVV